MIALPRARYGAENGLADADRFGVDKDEGDAGPLIAAVCPGVVGPTLDHDVTLLQLHGRVVHIHLDLAFEDDDVIDRLGAVHSGRLPGGKSITQKRVPLGAGAVPTMRAPISSKLSPTGMAGGVWSVTHISVERPPGRLALVEGASDITLATLFMSWPVMTRRIGG